MTKTFHVELWDVEGEYITSRAIDASTPQEAASKALGYAKRMGADRMTVRSSMRSSRGVARSRKDEFAIDEIEKGGMEDAAKRGAEEGA